MTSRSETDRPSGPAEAGKSAYKTVSEVVFTGIAIVVPIFVTMYVLRIALSFLNEALQPFVELLRLTGVLGFLERVGLVTLLIEIGLYDGVIGMLSELIALTVLSAIIVFAGVIAYHPVGERLVDYFDVFVASIPGIGTVYRSFRRMGDIMLDDEVENFQEVKLVELLGEGTYVIGFEVGDSPPVVRDVVGGDDDADVITMFIPFAPNPVTGGFLTYVSESQILDVEMTVEEGIRNVITSGVAGHESEAASVDLPVDAEDVQEFLDGETSLPGDYPEWPGNGRDAQSNANASADGDANSSAKSTSTSSDGSTADRTASGDEPAAN